MRTGFDFGSSGIGSSDGATESPGADSTVPDRTASPGVDSVVPDSAAPRADTPAPRPDTTSDHRLADMLAPDGSPSADSSPASTAFTWLWSKHFGSASGENSGADVAIDGADNLYITGKFQQAVSFGGATLQGGGSGDILLASYTAAGAHRWSKGLGGTGVDWGSGLALDSASNIYLTGAYRDAADFGGGEIQASYFEDVFVASYSSSGAHRWSRGMGGTSTDRGTDIAVDTSGNVYATGYFASSVDFGAGSVATTGGGYDGYLAKYGATTGSFGWAMALGGSMPDYGEAVAVDGAGNIYVAGEFDGPLSFGGPTLEGTMSTVYIVSYDAAGNHRWSASSGARSYGWASALAVDPAGNVFVTGTLNVAAGSEVDFGGGPLLGQGANDVFVASFSSTGAHRWSKLLGGTGSEGGADLALDRNGNVCVTGSFDQSASFGGASLSSAGSNDVFIACFDLNGVHRWSARFGGSGDVRSGGIAVDSADDLYVIGSFRGSADFGAGAVTAAGIADIFLVKLRR